MEIFYSQFIYHFRGKVFLTFKLIFFIACFLFSNANLHANASFGELELKAVDVNGNLISHFTAGEYVRVNASAKIYNLPKYANAKISITAYFTTVVLGKKISYSFTLPASGLASSRINPIQETSDFSLPVGNELQNSSFLETIDFQIPPQTPEGTLTFAVTATATSAKQVKRKFRFNIVR